MQLLTAPTLLGVSAPTMPGALATSGHNMFLRLGKMSTSESLVPSGFATHVDGPLSAAIASAKQLSTGDATGIAVVTAGDGFDLLHTAIVEVHGRTIRNDGTDFNFRTTVAPAIGSNVALQFQGNHIGGEYGSVSKELAAFVDEDIVLVPDADGEGLAKVHAS